MEFGPPPTRALVTRWIVIAGAGGAAIAAGLAHFIPDSNLQSVAFVAALLALAGALGLWRTISVKNKALLQANQQSGARVREMTALTEELELHRRLERELVEAKQTAESAMLAKGEFLATMSHEIRTPLNGILPMLDLLMTSRLATDQMDIVRTAYTSAKQMQRIVDDILDYSKLEANKLQLETTSFNLRELLDSVIRPMDKPAEGKGLKLVLSLDPAVRLAVRGDPVRLRQILSNLISNAVKFTERGSVTVQVTRKGESKTAHDLRFEVKDTGIGIAKENSGRLFRAFSQADASTTRLYGGTGLGLVICKRIVDLMGGNIGVESEPGRGSNFWFEVPLLKAAGDTQGQRADLNGARLLLLSTDATLRQRLNQAAPGWGVQLTVCETTQDALTRLRNGVTRGATWSFDLLVTDLASVRNTAVALHRNLRRTPELEDLRVVWLQGDEPAPVELSEGTTGLMVARGLGPHELRAALTNFMASSFRERRVDIGNPSIAIADVSSYLPTMMTEPEAAPMTASAAAAPQAPAVASDGRLHGRVLLVEDNPVNLMVAQRLLAMLGLTCETADNGEKALDRMNRGNLDLVLMDCQMPVKDGYTATTEWRQHEIAQGWSRLPIIAMTANAMAGDRQKCLDAGMDDYLSKPVDRRVLEATLMRWLQPRAASGPAPHAAAIPARQAPAHTPAPMPSLPSATQLPMPPPQPYERPAPTPAPVAATPAPMPAAATSTTSRFTLLSREEALGYTPQTPGANPAPAPAPQAPPAPVPAPAPAPVRAPSAAPAPATPARAPAPAGASASAITGPIPAVAAEPAAPPVPVLDMEVVEELRSVMGSEYLSLVKLFLEDAPGHVARLESAAAGNDVAQMVAPAHTLKSSSANLGAMALSQAAKRIELGARQGTLPRPAVAVAVLEQELKRAQVALQGLLRG